MWTKEDSQTQGATPGSTINVPATAATFNPQSSMGPISSSVRPVACISQGIRIKGEVTGNEDLFVDGLVDGKLSLTNGSLTIGPNGIVKADVSASEVIVRGKIEGKVTGREKVQLCSTGQVIGEVQTERLSIEEGALLRGMIEAGRQPSKTVELKAVAAAAGSGMHSDSISLNSGTAAN